MCIRDSPGTYVLAYDYSDADGKAAVTRKRTVEVKDTTLPVITLIGPSTVTHTLGEPYKDAGATAEDSVSGNLEVYDSYNFYADGLIAHWNFEDIADGVVRDSVAGQDGVLRGFDPATDHIDGVRGKALNFDGVDNKVDVVALGRNPSETTIAAWLLRRNGNQSSIVHSKGWALGDLHFIVQNDLNFALNGMGQQGGGGGNDFRSIDPLKIDQWVHVAATYSLAGKRVRFFIDGQLARETTFTGNRRLMLKDGLHIGADHNGIGRYLNGAIDELAIYDRALTAHQVEAVMGGGQPIDVQKEGQYTITFTTTDGVGNKATATRTVIVTADPDAPVITLLGNAEAAHEAGTTYEDPGATVADKDGNALDAKAIVVAGEVKADAPGQYVLTYDFTDAAGGKAMQIRRTVTVADTLAPIITLNGEKDMHVGINAEFTDPGATAKDAFEGDLQVAVSIPKPIDTSAAADFEITYSATDTAGNKAEVTRTVKVLPDTTPPVITLIGEVTVSVTLGTQYDDEGATAVDNIDKFLTAFIEDSGTVDAVDTSKEGTYVITYDVTDAAGNKAVQVTRTVIVKSSDPFYQWMADLPAEQQKPDSDPDNDGVPNLLEYALGGDAATADRAVFLPVLDASGSNLVLTFYRIKSTLDSSVTIEPQITTSLDVTWSKDGLTLTGALQGVQQSTLPDGKAYAQSRFERVQVTADTSKSNAGSKQFIRIAVTRN